MVAVLLRVSWRTVAAVVTGWWWPDLAVETYRLDGSTRIGIDEIAHRKVTAV